MLGEKIFNYKFLLIFFYFIIYIITAFNSVGFYSDDEHFQILEPVAYLFGLNTILLNDPLGFYWEWQQQHRIRPWLQPYFYYYIANFLKYLGFFDPHVWALIFRLTTAFLGFISIVYLFFSIKRFFIKEDKIYHYLIYFTFWFFPFLNVRTSSENLSIIFFCFAFSFLINLFDRDKSDYKSFYIIFFGFVLGLSIVVRAQMIFTIFPIFLWVVIYKFNIRKILLVVIGAFTAVTLGLYVDYLNWGYFTNTYWQIFEAQILKGRMAAFGAQPWWYYFKAIPLELAPLSSVFFIIGVFIYTYFNLRNVFIWAVFGTLTILLFFDHKEIRFFFPVYIFAPFFLMYFFDLLKNNFYKKFFLSVSLFSNFIFLIIIILVPMNGKVPIYKYIYYQDILDEKIYYIGENPYSINDMEPFFYTRFIPEISKLDQLSLNENAWIITNDFVELEKINKKNNCKLMFSSYPFFISLNENWKKKKINWYINYCRGNF